MKKFLALVVVSLSLAAPTFAEAQSAANFNVLGVLVNVWSGSFETVIPGVPNVTVKGDVSYSPNFVWVSNIGYFSGQGSARYYLGSLLPKGLPEFLYGEPLKGAFAGAGLGVYSVWTWVDTGAGKYEGSYLSPDAFVEVGDKYFFDNHFYAEGVLGYDLVLPAKWTWKLDGKTIASYSYTYSYQVGGARLGVNLGYAF